MNNIIPELNTLFPAFKGYFDQNDIVTIEDLREDGKLEACYVALCETDNSKASQDTQTKIRMLMVSIGLELGPVESADEASSDDEDNDKKHPTKVERSSAAKIQQISNKYRPDLDAIEEFESLDSEESIPTVDEIIDRFREQHPTFQYKIVYTYTPNLPNIIETARMNFKIDENELMERNKRHRAMSKAMGILVDEFEDLSI